MMTKPLIGAEEVRALFDYSPDDGYLRWRAAGPRRTVGAVAGTINGKYRTIAIWDSTKKRNRQYYAHRLIWLWAYGYEPPDQVDHINMDGMDNRLANLRLATKSQNLANQRTRCRSGFKGVWQHGNKWVASVGKDGVLHYLGTHATPELAHAAYCEAARKLHGEFARTA